MKFVRPATPCAPARVQTRSECGRAGGRGGTRVLTSGGGGRAGGRKRGCRGAYPSSLSRGADERESAPVRRGRAPRRRGRRGDVCGDAALGDAQPQRRLVVQQQRCVLEALEGDLRVPRQKKLRSRRGERVVQCHGRHRLASGSPMRARPHPPHRRGWSLYVRDGGVRAGDEAAGPTAWAVRRSDGRPRKDTRLLGRCQGGVRSVRAWSLPEDPCCTRARTSCRAHTGAR